jgi:uncharacterized membrane protein YgdD (TMEM256/DUF423 family)
VNSISSSAAARQATSRMAYAHAAAPLLRVVILPVQQQSSETESWYSVAAGVLFASTLVFSGFFEAAIDGLLLLGGSWKCHEELLPRHCTSGHWRLKVSATR